MTTPPDLQTTTSADGTTLGYLRQGTGPALVVTHGSVATSEQWLPALAHLSESFTCLVHDRRGRGRSGDGPTYDLDTEVADIAAMIELAGPGAHLLGHSYGALCALAYAERRGLDGGHLVAFEPPLAVDGPVAGENLATYRSLIADGHFDEAFAWALVHFVRVPEEAVPHLRATPLWSACAPLTPTWTRELEQTDALGSDLAHYASIEAPTGVIAGTATTPFLLTSAHELTATIPGAQLLELEDLDHFAHLVDPPRFADAVRRLIDPAP